MFCRRWCDPGSKVTVLFGASKVSPLSSAAVTAAISALPALFTAAAHRCTAFQVSTATETMGSDDPYLAVQAATKAALAGLSTTWN